MSDQMRESFENWAPTHNYSLEWDKRNSTYFYQDTRNAWEVWQACAALNATNPSSERTRAALRDIAAGRGGCGEQCCANVAERTLAGDQAGKP